MNTILTLVLSIVIGSGALLVGAAPHSRSSGSSAPATFEPCPPHLIAPYGGMDGWSTINVQANFARALLSPTGMMTCQYRFGTGRPFFGIQKACPAGKHCIPLRNGFRIVP